MQTQKWSIIGAVIVGVIVSLTWASPARADGIIIPEPPPWPDPPPLRDTWLTIRYHRVQVTIEDQVATTRVEQEFVNPHEWEAEGTYVFPLPQGATVSAFAMWVDGQRVEGEILQADEARAIYEEIVRRRRDPALLEYVGRDAVQASIFPIPPGGSRKVELEYSQILPVENGLVRYVYPLNTEKFSARPLEDVSVRVDIRSRDAMRAVYSPTHQDRVFIEREDDYEAIMSYEETDVLPQEDFEVIYTVSQEDVGVNLLTYREPPDDGYFLLLVAPPVSVDAGRIVPRDVLLVLDTSGSMEGEKVEQAQDALAYVLEHLNPEDRFNVIAFSSGLRQYATRPQPVAEAPAAIDWVERLEAIGGTDINRALLEALAQVDPERPTVLIFLTDGQPTEGVTGIENILSQVADAAPENVRLFPFGVGDDVNTTLLDALAERHRGAPAYVRPHERIDEEISAFYAMISQPVLTDLALDFGGIVAEDSYPHPLPDLFAGTQLILAGRYRGDGPTTITLSGAVNGERQRFVYEGLFRAEGGDEFIPRLWATRKIGHLLTQIRLHGEREEWVEAVVELSVRYGIVTPYTSFLIDERDILTARGQEEAAEKLMTQPTAPAVGAPAVEMAEDEAQMRAAESGGGLVPQEAQERVRIAGTKTFVLQDGVWVDTVFAPDRMETQPVQFGSADYFELLAARPEWGAYLALGERVIFVAEGTAYEVTLDETAPIELPPATDTVAPTPAPSVTPNPSATPVSTDVTAPTSTDPNAPVGPGGLCAGALAVGTITLAVMVVWGKINALVVR